MSPLPLHTACVWISWYQPTKDHRPLIFPPNDKIMGWWCTGKRADGASTMVAFVVAETYETAQEIICKDWPEAVDNWRFHEHVTNKQLSDRFPLSPWMEERFNMLT